MYQDVRCTTHGHTNHNVLQHGKYVEELTASEFISLSVKCLQIKSKKLQKGRDVVKVNFFFTEECRTFIQVATI